LDSVWASIYPPYFIREITTRKIGKRLGKRRGEKKDAEDTNYLKGTSLLHKSKPAQKKIKERGQW